MNGHLSKTMPRNEIYSFQVDLAEGEWGGEGGVGGGERGGAAKMRLAWPAVL